MTREETKKCIEIMQAYVDGEEIEVLRSLDSDWEKTSYPQWDWDSYTYRIKPKPMKVTEEEKDYMAGVWVKLKNTNSITYVKLGAVIDNKNYYVLNSNTMEWEDWSEK